MEIVVGSKWPRRGASVPLEIHWARRALTLVWKGASSGFEVPEAILRIPLEFAEAPLGVLWGSVGSVGGASGLVCDSAGSLGYMLWIPIGPRVGKAMELNVKQTGFQSGQCVFTIYRGGGGAK